MRRAVFAGLLLLLAADPAAAQFRRPLTSPAQATRYLPPPRYPRLAAFAQPAVPALNWPGYVLPGVYNNRPLARILPVTVQGALAVMSFIDTPALLAVGNAGPPAIRLAHVLLNGTPTPGEPLQTMLFIASPVAADVRARWSWRRAGCR